MGWRFGKARCMKCMKWSIDHPGQLVSSAFLVWDADCLRHAGVRCMAYIATRRGEAGPAHFRNRGVWRFVSQWAALPRRSLHPAWKDGLRGGCRTYAIAKVSSWGVHSNPLLWYILCKKTSGWRRFRAEDFNAEILAPGIGGERGWDHGSNIGSIIGSYLI